MKPPAPAAALAALATAVDLAALERALPACSLRCLAEGAAAHGCAAADLACQCSRVAPITATVAPCLVRAGCTLENITATAEVVLDVCRHQVPDPAGVSARATAGSSTGAASAAAALAPLVGRLGAAAVAVAAVVAL